MTRYVYYVRFSVWYGNELLANGAYEYILDKKIDSLEDLQDIIENIKVEDEIDDESYIVIDFYSFLHEETVSES